MNVIGSFPYKLPFDCTILESWTNQELLPLGIPTTARLLCQLRVAVQLPSNLPTRPTAETMMAPTTSTIPGVPSAGSVEVVCLLYYAHVPTKQQDWRNKNHF